MPVVIKEMKDYLVYENMIKDEIWLLKSSHHPNLQFFVEAYMHEGVVWAISQYCRGGTLTEFIRAVLPSEAVVAYICKEILEGLKYLHKQGRFHRDLKAENIVIYFDGGVKIADLDLCDDLVGDSKVSEPPALRIGLMLTSYVLVAVGDFRVTDVDVTGALVVRTLGN